MRSDFCPTCLVDLAPGEVCLQCRDDQSSAAEQGDVLHPGCTVGGKYKVGRLLGRGGFGATYLAWDINLRVRVAVKEFLPRQLVSRVSGGTQVYAVTGTLDAFNIALEKFLEEARHLAQFRDHPGIISVLDFFPENGTGYMVMEYLDGTTLEQYLTAKGGLEIPVVLQLLVPIADALRACHVAGLIHRDISPDNIFLTRDGRVKLLDFGAARTAVGPQNTNLSVIVKEGYAPFEQYQRNGRQGPWTDIYALTATLYRLLTGDLPVTAPDRVAGTPLPPPSDKGVKLPPGLQGLLDKGLAIHSKQRYQTVDAFLSDLKAVIGTHGSRSKSRESSSAIKLPSGLLSYAKRTPLRQRSRPGSPEALANGSVITPMVDELPDDRPPSTRARLDGPKSTHGSEQLSWTTRIVLIVAALLLVVPAVWGGRYFLTRSPPPDKLRATLAAATAGYQCAALNYAVGPDGAVDISGHVSTPDDLERLRNQVGDIRSISGAPHFDVKLIIWPYCEVVDLLSPLLVRPSRDAPRLNLASESDEARIGECLKLNVVAPSFDSFIYVDYFDAEGEVLHLLPNRWDMLNRKALRDRFTLGRTSQMPDCWRLAGNTGEQFISLIATTKSLFSDRRPDTESARDYIASLSNAIKAVPQTDAAAATLFFNLRD